MDGQHRRLLEAAGRISAMLDGGAGRADLPQALQALACELAAHHEEEERFMRWLAYPGLEAHRAGHRAQAGRLQALLDRARRSAGGGDVRALLLDVVAETTRHIDDDDRAIGGFALDRVTGR
jgi:hemerythrin-like metal-binding protein